MFLNCLQLYYVHATNCEEQYINRKVRPVCFWNYGRLKTRENLEMNKGKFGLVTLAEEEEEDIEDETEDEKEDETEDDDDQMSKKRGKEKQVQDDAEKEDDIGPEVMHQLNLLSCE